MRTLIAVGFGLGLGVAACGPDLKRVLNPNHCANQSGDDWCAARYGEARPFCDWGCNATEAQDGCVEARPVEDECYSPCGGEVTVLEDASCLGVASTGTETGTSSESSGSSESSESGSESSSTTGPMPCVSDEECTDAEAPFCGVDGECGACSGTADPDAACAGADPGLPLCVGDACVACTPENPATCTGETPICDGPTNTCVPCVAHDQCGGAACNLYSGACLPADRVFEVGGATPDFPSLSAAFASLEADTESTLVVYPGMPSYDEAVVVDGGRVVAFLAAEVGPGVEPPRWVRTSGMEPQLTVGAGATVLMDGLALAGNLSAAVPGLRVDGGRAWVDRSRIVQNSGGGVLAETGAELVLRNCFVGGADNAAAVEVDGSTARITFSTLGGGGFTATGLSCTAPDAIEVRSSIIVALGIMATGAVDVACSVADISFTATETPFVGAGNVTVGELPFMTPGDWFMDFSTGNFHLQNEGLTLFADVAQWQAGDPPTDIDGDPRPAVDGTLDYAGADVP